MPFPILAWVGRIVARVAIDAIVGELEGAALQAAARSTVPKIVGTVEVDTRPLDKLRRSVPEILTQAHTKTAAKAQAAARSGAAAIADTGNLARSIDSRIRVYPGGRIVSIVGPRMSATGTKNGRVMKPYRYAPILCKGSKHSRPRPFLPTPDSYPERLRAATAEGVRRVIG